MHFQLIYSKSKRQWRFRLVAANGRIIVWSEHYQNKSDAEDAIELVRSTSTLNSDRGVRGAVRGRARRGKPLLAPITCGKAAGNAHDLGDQHVTGEPDEPSRVWLTLAERTAAGGASRSVLNVPCGYRCWHPLAWRTFPEAGRRSAPETGVLTNRPRSAHRSRHGS